MNQSRADTQAAQSIHISSDEISTCRNPKSNPYPPDLQWTTAGGFGFESHAGRINLILDIH